MSHDDMVLTKQLRWNKNPDGGMRLEQLWIQDDGFTAWVNPIREWRPIELVKIGFDPTDFSKPPGEVT